MVDNVQGAQRELMKYWSRVSGNRWLVAKMFGVLMVGFRAFQKQTLLLLLIGILDFLPLMGAHCRLKELCELGLQKRWRLGMRSWGIDWPESGCIDYHASIGLERVDPSAKNRMPADERRIDCRSVIYCPGTEQPREAVFLLFEPPQLCVLHLVFK